MEDSHKEGADEELEERKITMMKVKVDDNHKEYENGGQS